MQRLYKNIIDILDIDMLFVGICEKNYQIKDIKENYCVNPLREKYGIIKTLVKFPVSIFLTIFYCGKILKKYNVRLIISTGPGIAIMPFILGKILGKKTIYIETWSRFSSTSLTGRCVYGLSDEFFIQNTSLQNVYPKAEYSGLL